MKKIFFCILIAFLCSTMYSKDYIIKKDGQNIDCTAITGEDDSNIYFHFYSGEEEVNTSIKKSDVKEYNFSNRDKFLKKQKMESLKKENEEKKLRIKDSLAVVNAKLLETKKIQAQKKNDSLAANAKLMELNKIQKQKEKDSLASNAKSLEFKKMQVQRKNDSIAAANAKLIELNKIQKQKDSLAIINAKSLSMSSARDKSVVAVNTMPQQGQQLAKYNAGDYLIRAGNSFVEAMVLSVLSGIVFASAASNTSTSTSGKTTDTNNDAVNFFGGVLAVGALVCYINIPINLHKAGHAYKKEYVVR